MSAEYGNPTPVDGVASIEREGLVYSHNFPRYFDLNGQQIDRLDQALRFGIASPRKAKQLGIPYRREMDISIAGSRNYDNVIFLFPTHSPKYVPLWSDSVTIALSGEMRVLTPEEMRKYQHGAWVNASPTHGEVYRFGRIDQQFFREIILPTTSSRLIEEAEAKVKLHLPLLADQIKVRGHR